MCTQSQAATLEREPGENFSCDTRARCMNCAMEVCLSWLATSTYGEVTMAFSRQKDGRMQVWTAAVSIARAAGLIAAVPLSPLKSLRTGRPDAQQIQMGGLPASPSTPRIHMILDGPGAEGNTAFVSTVSFSVAHTAMKSGVRILEQSVRSGGCCPTTLRCTRFCGGAARALTSRRRRPRLRKDS